MECTGDKYKQVHCTKMKHYPAVALTVICNDSNTVITNKQYMKFPSCYSCLFSHAEAMEQHYSFGGLLLSTFHFLLALVMVSTNSRNIQKYLAL